MRSAADTTKRVHLELGGKAPVLVFADADLDAMAQAIAMGATYNTGQDCTAATRVYAQASVFDAVREKLRQKFASIRFGDPDDASSDIGPLISHEHRQRVHRFVEQAVREGACVCIGGAIPEGNGFYYPPTLICDVQQNSDIVQKEVFGPVLVIIRAHDVDEALAVEKGEAARQSCG